MNTLVKFELAKLLKEKGFDLYCVWSYWNGELTSHTPGYALEDGTTSQENYWDFDRYYAPTIAEVVMLLYEKHRVWISVHKAMEVKWTNDYFNYEILSPKGTVYSDIGGTQPNTSTEAYEAAIEYTLKNLI